MIRVGLADAESMNRYPLVLDQTEGEPSLFMQFYQYQTTTIIDYLDRKIFSDQDYLRKKLTGAMDYNHMFIIDMHDIPLREELIFSDPEFFPKELMDRSRFTQKEVYSLLEREGEKYGRMNDSHLWCGDEFIFMIRSTLPKDSDKIDDCFKEKMYMMEVYASEVSDDDMDDIFGTPNAAEAE